MAPGITGKGDRIYQVAHNLIKSHAKAYRVYEKEFKQKQKGTHALFVYKICIELVWESTEYKYVFNIFIYNYIGMLFWPLLR